MTAGWIKLHRDIENFSFYPKTRKFTPYEAWLDLLMRAHFRPSMIPIGTTILDIQRGEIFTSQIALSKRWRWNRRTIKRFLLALKMHNRIDIRTSRGTESSYTIITILNYDAYSGTSKDENFAPYSTECTTETPTDAQPMHNSEEDKESKEDKNIRAEAKQFVDWFFKEYQSRFSSPYYVNGKKDLSRIRNLLGTYKLEQLQGAAKRFLNTDDAFVIKAGFTLGVFYNTINKFTHPNPRGRGRVKAEHDFSKYDRFD